MSISRRTWLKSTTAASIFAAGQHPLVAQDPAAEDCPDCGGVGFLPLLNRKPYVQVEGQAAPRPADAVPHRFCPQCRANRDASELAEQELTRLKTATEAHKKWERETGFRLVRVETRHLVVHSQHSVAEATKMGHAFETLAAQLQGLTNSMELTPTRPDTYEQMILSSQDSYEHFREVLERLYTREQLGDQWSISRGLTAFDHPLLPFLYESPQTIKRRPPAHAVCFFGGKKQLLVATASRGPRWLCEGFAAYCEFAALKKNLWCSVYNQNKCPEPGDWGPQLKKLAVKRELRPWKEQVATEIRDWEARDYLQTFGMVAFLLSKAPKGFLTYVRSLKSQPESPKLLEKAYDLPLDQLEAEFSRWISAG